MIINNFGVSTFLSLDQPVKVARKIIIFSSDGRSRNETFDI